jgi:steroid 5-alpha reductase family enzyme
MRKSRSSRSGSLWALTGIYGLAIAFGTLTYLFVGWNNEIGRMLLADIAATLVVWLFGIVLDNSSVYDPYWSVIPPIVIGGWILSLRPERWEGIAALGFAVLFWALRLTRNWYRGWIDFSHQDWRYTMIRESRPNQWFLANLFGIHLLPTGIVFLQLTGVPTFLLNGPRLNVRIVIGL